MYVTLQMTFEDLCAQSAIVAGASLLNPSQLLAQERLRETITRQEERCKALQNALAEQRTTSLRILEGKITTVHISISTPLEEELFQLK